MQEVLPRELWCRNFAHLMRVGLPICMRAKEVVEIASHLASGTLGWLNGVTLRWRWRVATRHVRKTMVFFLR
jgi:hypothetical protein